METWMGNLVVDNMVMGIYTQRQNLIGLEWNLTPLYIPRIEVSIISQGET